MLFVLVSLKNLTWLTTLNLISFGLLIGQCFEWSEEEERYMSAHHPFTLPTEESAHELEGDLAKVRAVAYDIVLNGYELGGGSLRINQKEIARTYV